MNQVQELYMEAKAAYDAALEKKEISTTIEDSYFKAQDDIVEWALKYNVKQGNWDSDDAAFLRKCMKAEQRTKLANNALRYNVTICPKCISENYGIVAEWDVKGSDERVTVTECEDCGYTES